MTRAMIRVMIKGVIKEVITEEEIFSCGNGVHQYILFNEPEIVIG